MPLVVSCSGESSGQPLERAEHGLLGDRQVVADLGPLVQLAAQLDVAVSRSLASSRREAVSTVMGPW